jgi:hypothetical protein
MTNTLRNIMQYFSKFCRIDYLFCSRKYKHNYTEIRDLQLNEDNTLDKYEINF